MSDYRADAERLTIGIADSHAFCVKLREDLKSGLKLKQDKAPLPAKFEEFNYK
jgi:hypothetical protein